MSEELRFHIGQYADDLVQMELGSLTNVKSDCREASSLPSGDGL
jgi:hypothetical protein